MGSRGGEYAWQGSSWWTMLAIPLSGTDKLGGTMGQGVGGKTDLETQGFSRGN